MKKALIVVDMQKDFVDGSLGTPAAQSIVPAVVEKIRAFRGDALLVTLDTHGADYLQTLEGKKLPVPHCIKGTPGHALHSEIQAALSGKPHTLVEKNTFGSFDVARLLAERFPGETPEIELVGLCTDICVLSNALLLRAAFPNAPHHRGRPLLRRRNRGRPPRRPHRHAKLPDRHSRPVTTKKTRLR